VIAATLRNEVAKQRRRSVGWLVAAMVLAVVALAPVGVLTTPGLDVDDPDAWLALLAGMTLAVALTSPLLLATLASRQTEVEHQGSAWLMQSTAGLTPGRLCRAKWTVLTAIVVGIAVAQSWGVLAAGRLLGLSSPPPIVHWAVCTAAMAAVSLVLLALHVLISAALTNQLGVLAVGLLGTLVAVFSRGLPDIAAHLTPWGYYALAGGAEHQGDVLEVVDTSIPSIVGLVAIAVVAFTIITHRLDRLEA